jgi:NitT/TauT family transport system permease protein
MDTFRRNTLDKASVGARLLSPGDILIVVALVGILYAGIRLASPTSVVGPDINLSPSALPWYTFLSMLRMTASYFLSLAFSLVYAYIAAHNRAAERVMLPVLDVLQSVPLLSFLPVALVFLTTLLPSWVGIEASAVVLIFTSQAWNIAYSFHQSVKTVPLELNEAAASFRMNWWYRLRYLELPFGMLGLIWNSVVSWANGWFFLMAAETFRVQSRDFRLPGLGSYLQAAADAGDGRAIIFGLITLIVVVVLLDQLVWQPLLAWAEKFSMSLVTNDNMPRSWFLDVIRGSRLVALFKEYGRDRLVKSLDGVLGGLSKPADRRTLSLRSIPSLVLKRLVPLAALAILGYFIWQAAIMLVTLPLGEWHVIATATVASTIRVFVSTLLGLLLTVPLGVWVGLNPRLSARFQPIIQSAAAIPGTAVFPVLVAWIIALPLGLEIAAQFLIISTTAWYLLFNIIAGAAAIPTELKDASQLYRINGWTRWRTLIWPAILPYVITGLNVAGGGAWNASIVAEYTQYKGQTYSVLGLGSAITQSTAVGDYPMLLAATFTMILTVIVVNTFFWQRVHRFVQEKYRLG